MVSLSFSATTCCVHLVRKSCIQLWVQPYPWVFKHRLRPIRCHQHRFHWKNPQMSCKVQDGSWDEWVHAYFFYPKGYHQQQQQKRTRRLTVFNKLHSGLTHQPTRRKFTAICTLTQAICTWNSFFVNYVSHILRTTQWHQLTKVITLIPSFTHSTKTGFSTWLLWKTMWSTLTKHYA